MKREFYIYKNGVTTKGKICILSKENEPFNYDEKVKFYLSLGYDIYKLNGQKY